VVDILEPLCCIFGALFCFVSVKLKVPQKGLKNPAP